MSYTVTHSIKGVPHEAVHDSDNAECLSPRFASAGQIIAGTAEDKMFQRITAATHPDAKLQTLIDFEKQFPHSKVLPDVFLMIIDLHRQKGDRLKVIEYGEKVLKLDERNVTAMMVLARNYAIEEKQCRSSGHAC